MARCKHDDAHDAQHLPGWKFCPTCRNYIPDDR